MRAFLILFLLSLSLRVGLLFLIPRDLIPPNPLWETGAVSISLATKGEFADPYLIPTGPTAHMPPLGVAALSLLYRAFGFGFLGGFLRWVLAAIASSVLWALMPWLGETLGVGRRAGILGGLAGAFFLTFPSELESYSGLALALLAVVFLLRWRGLSESAGPWLNSLLLGFGLGVLFHLQPVLLAVVFGYLAFELWWYRGGGRWRFSGLVALGIFLACIPWGVRNYMTFHQIFFVRGNLGLELYVGNHDGAHADIDVSASRGSFQHPRTDLAEAQRVLELGEGLYMETKLEEALGWIRAHPGEFMRLTGTRFLYFWAGPLHQPAGAAPYLALLLMAVLGIWRAVPSLDPLQRGALFIPLATYPIIYYLVAYMPRYGEPLRWALFLLAGAAFMGSVQPPAMRSSGAIDGQKSPERHGWIGGA